MQQQTLVLYTRLKAAKKMPAGFFMPSPGTPAAHTKRDRGGVGGGRGGEGPGGDDTEEESNGGEVGGDAGDEAAFASSATRVMDVSSRAADIFTSRARGFGNRGSLGTRMILTVWRGWARSETVLTRRVATLRRRWLARRLMRWLRAWQRIAAIGEREAAAAAASVRRYQRRCQRRVFMTWRGLAAGLATHELALMGSSVGMFTPGSPAAGLAAIAAMARVGVSSATTTPNGVQGRGEGRHATIRGAAMAAAMLATPPGNEEERRFGGGDRGGARGGGGRGGSGSGDGMDTPGSHRFATPLSTPGLGGDGSPGGTERDRTGRDKCGDVGGDEDEVFATPAPGWSWHVGGNHDDDNDVGGSVGRGPGLDFGARDDEIEGRKVRALLTWIDDILENDGLLPEDGFRDGNEEFNWNSGSVRDKEARAGAGGEPGGRHSEEPESPRISLGAAFADMEMLTPEKDTVDDGEYFNSEMGRFTAASTPTPQASPAPPMADIAGRSWHHQPHRESPSAYPRTPSTAATTTTGRVTRSLGTAGQPPGTYSGGSRSTKRASPLVSAFDAAAAAVSPSRVQTECVVPVPGGDNESEDWGIAPPDLGAVAGTVLDDVTVSIEGGAGAGADGVRIDHHQSSAGRRSASHSPGLATSPRGRTPPQSSDRARMARDSILSMAFERSAVAEAAVQMLTSQRVRALARRVLASWLSVAARSRAEAAEEELKSLKNEQATAAAVAAAAATAAATAAPPKSSARRWFAAVSAVTSPRKASSTPSSPRGLWGNMGSSLGTPSDSPRGEAPISPGPSAPGLPSPSPLKHKSGPPQSSSSSSSPPPPPAVAANPAAGLVSSPEESAAPSPQSSVAVESAPGSTVDGAAGDAAAEETANTAATSPVDTDATVAAREIVEKGKQNSSGTADHGKATSSGINESGASGSREKKPAASTGCGCCVS